MKEYTAIYSTKSLTNVQYSFEAEDLYSAVGFCQGKFTVFPNVVIIENTPNGRANEGLVVWVNGYVVI